MSAIGYAILLGFAGTFAAALWTFVIGLAGAPGALLTAAAMRRIATSVIPIWGLLLTVAGQLYASLAFTAFILGTSSSVLANTTGFGKWVAWVVTFCVASAPALIALKDAARAEAKNVQHAATTLTAPLATVGFLVFLFAPRIRALAWGWIPHF